MAQISGRPNRTKLIAALKDSIKSIEKDAKEYQDALDQYKKYYKAWSESADLSPENIKTTQIVVGSDRYDSKKEEWVSSPRSVEVVLKKYPTNMPKRPTTPKFGTKGDYRYKEAVDEIASTIKFLELLDDDSVNASTANKVKQYL